MALTQDGKKYTKKYSTDEWVYMFNRKVRRWQRDAGVKRSIDGRVYTYCIYNEDLRQPAITGECIIGDIEYNPTTNRNHYTICDFNKHREFIIDEFYLRLWEA